MQRTVTSSAGAWIAGAVGADADIDQPTTTGVAGDLTSLSLAQASDLVRRRRVSPIELTNACLAKIERLNPRLNAFITVTADSALAQAHVAEQEIQRGRGCGPLHGIPIALKDLFDTAGVKTTAATSVDTQNRQLIDTSKPAIN